MFISCVKCPCNFMLSVTSSSSSRGGGGGVSSSSSGSSSNEPNDEIKLHLLCGKIVYSLCFGYTCAVDGKWQICYHCLTNLPCFLQTDSRPY